MYYVSAALAREMALTTLRTGFCGDDQIEQFEELAALGRTFPIIDEAAHQLDVADLARRYRCDPEKPSGRPAPSRPGRCISMRVNAQRPSCRTRSSAKCARISASLPMIFLSFSFFRISWPFRCAGPSAKVGNCHVRHGNRSHKKLPPVLRGLLSVAAVHSRRRLCLRPHKLRELFEAAISESRPQLYKRS